MVLQKLLNSPLNIQNKMSHTIIIKYLRSNELFRKKIHKEEEVINVFKSVFPYIDNLQKIALLEEMNNHDKIKKYLYENIEFMTKILLNNNTDYFIIVKIYLIIIKKHIYKFEDIKYLFDNLSIKLFLEMKKYLYEDNNLNFDEEELNKLKNYILEYYNCNNKEIVKNIVSNHLLLNESKEKLEKNREFSRKFDETYNNFFVYLINDLLKEQNTDILNFKKINSGAYSVVYQINEKILKIGIPRYTHNIPNHKLIIQPFIRYNLEFIYVEVMELVKTSDNLTKEDVYLIYKELRETGIVWASPMVKNIGILQKSNCSYINNKKIEINQIANGFDLNAKKILSSGDLVILDTDHLFYENEFNFIDAKLIPDLEYYETKYQFDKMFNRLKK